MPYRSRKRRSRSGGGSDGGSGDGSGGGGYKPGQHLHCKIMKREPGGYTVIVGREHLPGHLLSDKDYDLGQILIAQFSCMVEGRMRMEEIDVYEQHFGIGPASNPSDESASGVTEPAWINSGLEVLDSSEEKESNKAPFLHVVESGSEEDSDDENSGEEGSNVIDLFKDR